MEILFSQGKSLQTQSAFRRGCGFERWAVLAKQTCSAIEETLYKNSIMCEHL